MTERPYIKPCYLSQAAEDIGIVARHVMRQPRGYGRELGKRTDKRESGQVKKPEGTWTRVLRDDLRIVGADLAERCDRIRLDKKSRYHASLARGDGRVPERAFGRYLLSGGMLVCPNCGANFEMVKTPWNPGHYICSTRRRKPGVCANPLALPMAETDEKVLSIIEGKVLSRKYIEELLSLVDKGEVDHTERLTTDRSRLQTEVDNLVKSIAAGVPANTVAPAIRERETAIAKLDVQLLKPRQLPPDIERLRDALTQRAAEWKSELRGQPQIARLVLRRFIDPIVLHNPTALSPAWIAWEAAFKPALLDGLAVLVASLMPASWNHITTWLRQIEALRRAA